MAHLTAHRFIKVAISDIIFARYLTIQNMEAGRDFRTDAEKQIEEDQKKIEAQARYGQLADPEQAVDELRGRQAAEDAKRELGL